MESNDGVPRMSQSACLQSVAITILVLGVVQPHQPYCLRGWRTVGTNGAPATRQHPIHHHHSVPAGGVYPRGREKHRAHSAQFRLNGGALSITATDLSNDPGFSYSSWGNTHELELAHTQQVYTVASP